MWEPETLRLSFNFFWRLLGSVWHSNSFIECQKCVALFDPSHADTRATWRSTPSRSSRSRPCHVTPEIVHQFQWISTDLALWTLHWTPEGQPVPHKIGLNFHISSFVCTTWWTMMNKHPPKLPASKYLTFSSLPSPRPQAHAAISPNLSV